MKNKKVISFILTLAMIFAMATGFTTVGFMGSQEDVYATEYSGTCGDPSVNGGADVTWSFDDVSGVLTISGIGAMKDYASSSEPPWNAYVSDITKVVVGSGVTSIGDRAFINCSRIESVEMASVITIGEYAFQSCSNPLFYTIEFPASLTSIGNAAFANCTHISSITFKSVPTIADNAFSGAGTYSSGVVYIAPSALDSFKDMLKINGSTISAVAASGTWYYSLVSVSSTTAGGVCGANATWELDFPTGDMTIDGTGAMTDFESGLTPWNAYKSSISAVTIGSGITSVGSNSFKGTSVNSVAMPGVTSIGAYAFKDCFSLTTVSMPKVEVIEKEGFYRCNSLTAVDTPKLVAAGESAFDECRNVSYVNIPLLATFGKYAFMDCDKLAAVSIPKATTIDESGFNDCDILEAITIPASVTSIGKWAFRDSVSLSSIIFSHTTTTGLTIANNAFNNVASKGTITVEASALDGFLDMPLTVSGTAVTTDPAADWHYVVKVEEKTEKHSSSHKNKATQPVVEVTTPAIEQPVQPKQAAYTDIPTNAWYEEAANFCASHGIISGIAEGQFGGELNTGRGQIVTMLMRLENITGKADAKYIASLFNDIESDMYYAEAVSWAASNNIVKGIGADANGNMCFAPNRDVTREQLATILYNYAKYRNLDTSLAAGASMTTFQDAANTSPYANDALLWAIQSGIISGSNGVDASGNAVMMLNPQGTATRAEIAVMIMRLCNHFTELI